MKVGFIYMIMVGYYNLENSIIDISSEVLQIPNLFFQLIFPHVIVFEG